MVSDSGFAIEPFSANCPAIVDSGEHVVVGVSPGNSYFSVGLLERLLEWLRDRFSQVDVAFRASQGQLARRDLNPCSALCLHMNPGVFSPGRGFS